MAPSKRNVSHCNVLTYLVHCRALENQLRDTVMMSVMKLESIWLETGITGELLKGRRSTLLDHVNDLFRDMIAEETARQQQITASIECHLAAIRKISDELGQQWTAQVCDCKPLVVQLFLNVRFLPHCIECRAV